MKLQCTKLPLGILTLIVTLILVKTLFNAWNKPRLGDDGTITYKKSGERDNYLYKINDTIAFQVRLLPTMSAVTSEVVSYHQVGGVQGLLLGNNKESKYLFSPSEKKGDWVYTSYGKPGDYFAINTKTGELVKNETTSDKLYETDFYKERFEGGDIFKEEYILKNYDYISTYKESGSALLMAGVLLAGVCLIWALIALLLDMRKPRAPKTFAAPQHTGGRAPR